MRAALPWLSQGLAKAGLGALQGNESPLRNVDSEALLGKMASGQTLWFARQEAFWIIENREYCQCQSSQREGLCNFVVIYNIKQSE